MENMTMTTIQVQGNEHDVFEVYTDETREQTLCFCFSEEQARLIAAAPETKKQRDALWEALRRAQWLLNKYKIKDGLFEALRTTAGLPTELEQCEELLEVFAKATEGRT